MQEYTGICFPVLRECSSWASKNGAVQIFFWQQPETCFLYYKMIHWDFLPENLKLKNMLQVWGFE